MNLNTDFKIIEPITLDFAWIFKSIKIIEPITSVEAANCKRANGKLQGITPKKGLCIMGNCHAYLQNHYG